jgi:hypothetical protein
VAWPAKARVEFPGALYHVLDRGDRREGIFRDDRDREWFMETLGNYDVLNPLTYGGATLINGGGFTINGTTLAGFTLRDNGALTNTSSVTINYSTLNMSNSSGTLTDSTARLNSSAPITLNGGAIAFYGRANSLSSQAIGAVTLNQGVSVISSAEQSNFGTNSSATLTLASLARTPGSAATVQFAQWYQNNSAATIGQVGALSKFIVINNLNGAATTTVGAGLTNNLIGGLGHRHPRLLHH